MRGSAAAAAAACSLVFAAFTPARQHGLLLDGRSEMPGEDAWGVVRGCAPQRPHCLRLSNGHLPPLRRPSVCFGSVRVSRRLLRKQVCRHDAAMLSVCRCGVLRKRKRKHMRPRVTAAELNDQDNQDNGAARTEQQHMNERAASFALALSFTRSLHTTNESKQQNSLPQQQQRGGCEKNRALRCFTWSLYDEPHEPTISERENRREKKVSCPSSSPLEKNILLKNTRSHLRPTDSRPLPLLNSKLKAQSSTLNARRHVAPTRAPAQLQFAHEFIRSFRPLHRSIGRSRDARYLVSTAMTTTSSARGNPVRNGLD